MPNGDNSNSNGNEEDLELFKRYQTTKKLDEHGKIISTDIRLRNDLAQRNAKLVTFVINKFYNKKPEHKELRSDLLQEGHLGLLNAIDGFKPEMGFKFSTYSVWWIKQSVNSYLLDEEPALHIPSHIRTARNKLFNLVKARSMSFKDIDQTILDEIGMTEKMFASVNAAIKTKTQNQCSLNEPLSSSMNSKTLQDILPNNDVELGVRTDNRRLIEAAKKSFNRLNLRERCVLLERYQIDCKKLLMKGNKK